MTASIALNPPFLIASEGASSGFPISSNASKKESWSSSHQGAIDIQSTLAVKDASDNEYVYSSIDAGVGMLFKMPQDGQLALTFHEGGFTGYPQAYHWVSVENECGYSSVSIHAVVVPVGHVWTFGSKATSGALKLSNQPGNWTKTIVFYDDDEDDHSYGKGGILPHSIHFDYPNVQLKKDDWVLAKMGFFVYHRIKANDVTVSSKIDFDAKLKVASALVWP